MREYIYDSIFGVPIETLFRAWNIFSYIEKNGDDFFDYVRQKMKQRWQIFNNILEGQNNFIQHSRVGSQYGWIQCVNMSNETQIRSLFQSYNINPAYGAMFGSPGYVRFNLAEIEQNFIKIMARFKQLIDDHR